MATAIKLKKQIKKAKQIEAKSKTKRNKVVYQSLLELKELMQDKEEYKIG